MIDNFQNSEPQWHNYLMGEALNEGYKASQLGEVPVGAVLAIGGEIIARAHNEIETHMDATAHAEMLVIRRASKVIDNWRLVDATLCVTLEPCSMCAGAISLSRIGTVVFGARDPKMGAFGELHELNGESLSRYAHLKDVVGGVKGEEAAVLLKGFFSGRRKFDNRVEKGTSSRSALRRTLATLGLAQGEFKI